MRLTRCFALLLCLGGLARADVLPPAQDTCSTGGKLTLVNGKATTLAVSATRKSFVYFDLTTLPDVVSGDILSARLRIYFPSALKPGDLTLHAVAPVGTLWDENKVASVAEPTLAALPPAVTIPKTSVVAKKFVEIDVTHFVKPWLDDPTTNFGFAFTATGTTSVTLGAKEGPGSGYPCMLVLDIERPTPVGEISTAALADVSVTSGKLADFSVASGKLADLAVTSGKLADLSVTSGKLALNLTLTGDTTLAGQLVLPPTNAAGTAGVIRQGNVTLLHTFGSSNFFAGPSAGNFTTTGAGNTTAGAFSLSSNTSGSQNTAAGYQSMLSNTTGNNNTAAGGSALLSNSSGSDNTALGANAMGQASGSGNIGIGSSGGDHILGDNNIAIGHRGFFGESGIIRIGTPGVQTDTYLTGVLHGDASGLSFNLPATAADGTTGVIQQAGGTLLHTFGTRNFFAGPNAGNFTMTGFGQNIGIGDSALSANMTGGDNVAIGCTALQSNTTGFWNSALGEEALQSNTTGNYNVAVGQIALDSSTTGSDNTAIGSVALRILTGGSGNVAVGSGAGSSLITGTGNVILGVNAGAFLSTGNANILICSTGDAADNNTTRIGGDQQRAFIAGIRGVTTDVADAVTVMIDSHGQLGTVSSSRRYKEDIADMGDASARLLALRPVTFHYKKPYANGEKPVQFGLIAEEVATAFPELAVFNAQGEPETVKYQDLAPMLLNEVQKQQRRADAKDAEISELKKESAELRTRLEKLEAALQPRAK